MQIIQTDSESYAVKVKRLPLYEMYIENHGLF